MVVRMTNVVSKLLLFKVNILFEKNIVKSDVVEVEVELEVEVEVQVVKIYE